MAESRFEELDSDNVKESERYQEYEKKDSDTLSNDRDRLLNLREGDFGYDESRDKIITIDNILSEREGGGRTKFTKRMLDHLRAKKDIEDFVMKKYNVKVDWESKEGEDLENRIGLSPKGHLTYTRTGDDRSTFVAQIVMNYIKEELVYNEGRATEGIVKSIDDFKLSIKRLVEQSKDRRKTVEEMPMLPILGDIDLTPIEGLTKEENNEHRGVLHPSDSIIPESRTGENSALLIQAKHWDEKIEKVDKEVVNSSDPLEIERLTTRREGLTLARDKTMEQYNLEKETTEEREERESIRVAQEEDVSRLQRIKELFKGELAWSEQR